MIDLVERLRRPQYSPGTQSLTDEAADTIERLQARCAELEKDSTRYRWLRDQFRTVNPDMGGDHPWSFGHRARLRGPSIDEAIDAAMESKP